MKLPRTILLTLAFLTLASGVWSVPVRRPRPVGADWPRFRGPDSAAVSQDKGLPVQWSDTDNLVWKTKLPGPGGSSPITLGKQVFVTCYTGYGIPGGDNGDQQNLQRHLLCLDKASGKILWDKAIPAELPETNYRGFIALHGYASSTPATDGERVYVFFGKSGVLAFDLKGTKIWQTRVGKGTHGWGSATSPVLYKDLVIVNASVESGSLVALNKKTGKEEWKAQGTRGSWSSPVLVEVKDGQQELVLSVPRKILAFDPASGKSLWRCEGIQDGYVCPTVVAHKGIVYTIGGRRNMALAVRAGGQGDVTDTHRLWTAQRGSNVCSAVVFQDHLYWVGDGGTAYCLKTSDGEIVYEKSLNSGRVYASATAADGKLYVVSREKGTYVLAAEPKFNLLAHNTMASDESIFNGSPAVSAGRLLLRSDQYLYCIGKK